MPDMNDVQGELMDMIIADKSPSQISDRIKDMLFAKTADKVDGYKCTKCGEINKYIKEDKDGLEERIRLKEKKDEEERIRLKKKRGKP